ncbi:hypothetical protein ANCCAN_01196 [Ancylostoma caninum]|uniref:Uncharacterized protein n=1 Tax=Ancylostoma caninum TaxID=29170 RepID=A0A368H9V8_ANCCA|nr:hypothetical protein ANCCAN_01196 [Ancylostoma caninum]
MGTAMIMEDITTGMTTVGMEVGTITAGEVEGEDVIGMGFSWGPRTNTSIRKRIAVGNSLTTLTVAYRCTTATAHHMELPTSTMGVRCRLHTDDDGQRATNSFFFLISLPQTTL